MAYRWNWAAGIDPEWREALVRAFDPPALAPVAVASRRDIAGRRYGVLETAGSLPFDVFVKVFEHRSFRRRILHLWARSGAAREFANAVRLRGMGLPVPQPLALVSESGNWGCRTCYYLMERLTGMRPLSVCLAGACGPGSGEFDAVTGCVARLLVDLASKGVWHRDASADNLLVGPGGEGTDQWVCLVDARHARFGADPTEALERKIITLGAFLLVGGADDAVVEALVSAVIKEANGRSGPPRAPDREAVIDRAWTSAAHLMAREVRKGKRAPASLDVFARRYATASDAENYRDRRFGRSRHGRQVDAAERRLVGRLIGDLGVVGPVLDAPCGAGRFLPILACGGRDCTGVDVSAEMLGLAHRAAADEGVPWRVAMADARRLPFADGWFELALSMRLLHRVRTEAERVAVLRELARVSGRWVLFSFYNRLSWRGLRDGLRGRYPGETRAAIRREVADAGMRVEQFLPVGPLARQTLVLCAAPGR